MERGRCGLFAAALAAVVLGAAPAGASAHRYAAADSTDVTGACAVDAPCRLDWAIEGSAADDVVVVKEGTYHVDYRINPSVPVHVEGDTSGGRPKLMGFWNALDPAPAVLELLAGGSARHLRIETTDVAQGGLQLSGGTAEDLLVRSKGGAEAVTLLGGATGTLLRDSLVVNKAVGAAAVGIDDGLSGVEAVDLRNVTAVAEGTGAAAIDSRVVLSHVTLVNVVARGALHDLRGMDPKLDAGHSNFRLQYSYGVSDLGGNQDADPLFVDPAVNDYRTFSDSPTVDAGIADALTGTTDPDGVSRTFGGAPNIGAFEKTVASDKAIQQPVVSDVPAAPELVPDPAPVLGETVVGGVSDGQIAFKPAGSPSFVQLTGAASIPVGSLIDARRGAIRLRSASDDQGRSQVGVFRGAMFRVRQGDFPGAYTELKLAGGNFESCGRGATGRGAAVAARARSVRRLWSRSRRGRFRTRGRHGTATVRGTVWSTADRCDGTMVRVRRGRVLVRDLGRRRSVMVGAGRHYLARR
jgi:hypothetical protein